MSRERLAGIVAVLMIVGLLAASWFAYRAGHWFGSN